MPLGYLNNHGSSIKYRRYISGFPQLLFLLLFSFLANDLSAQSLSLLSWNIRDFGKTKDDAEILQIARIIKDYDVVAIQEVVAGYGGAQAVARLADQLNRMGSRWDYRISDPTQSPPYKTERYAFLWKPGKLKLWNTPWLEETFREVIFREPCLARFEAEEEHLIVLNFHSRRFDEAPEEEITKLDAIAAQYEPIPMLIAGDFNLSENEAAFDALRERGYLPVLQDQPTTLKTKCKGRKGNYLNHAIDNIFYPRDKMSMVASGIIDFVQSCEDLEAARAISDHLPVWVEVEWR